MICDDQKSELEKIAQLISEYAELHSELSLKIKCFSAPFEMLEEIDKNGAPDIALLDICMPGILGTQIAQEVLDKSENATDIIFLTISRDFAVEAFSLHVSDYLTKPYTKKRLTEALDSVIEKRRKRMYAIIQCGKEIHRIDLYDILYVEVKNHTVEIHLNSGHSLKTYITLTELKSLLKDISGFAEVGASYVVNFRYVDRFRDTVIEIANGDMVPVPRRLRSELKRQYFDFYTKEVTAR